MGLLNDENELQVDENNNKIWKGWKVFENVWYHNFKKIRYKLTASATIIQLIVNYKFMRPVSIWRLLKE